MDGTTLARAAPPRLICLNFMDNRLDASSRR